MNYQDKNKEELLKEFEKLLQEQNPVKGTFKNVQESTGFNLGKRMALVLLSSIFIGEVLVMLLIHILRIQLYWIEAPIDSLVLSILIFPAVYFLVIRPLTIQTTMRKQAEETLVKLKKAIYTSGEAIFLTDRKGILTFVNPAFTSLYGFSSDELVGKTTPRIINSGILDKSVCEVFWKTLLNGNEVRRELINKRKDGTLVNIESSASPIIDEEKNIIGFLGIQHNITERKLAEQKLVIANTELAFQKEEKAKRAAELIIAEKSDRLKTAFLNNISHEIRTPFNGILGFLSLIQNDDLTSSERDKYISIINKSAYRLMNTINDIAEISQIHAGQLNLTESRTNIIRLTKELYDYFKTDAQIKGLEFTFNNNLSFNIECISTDNIKLNTILTILINNAIKFTKAGSIEFSICKNGDYLEFFVKDTGIGIPENMQSKIFERFVQVNGSNNRQFEGSGLGLSIAKAYVEMLNGKIWVESEEGKGSVFYFIIPYKEVPEEKIVKKNIASAEVAENQIKDLKILIVEDDETSEMFLRNAIKLFSKEFIRARTGVEAVETCRNNPDIDLVMMDLKMPEMDGYEAIRQIRQFNKDVIIIAQTAFGLAGDREKAIEAGCNDYISKPFKKDELLSIIRKHVKL